MHLYCSIGRLSLLPSVGRQNEYQLSGSVIINDDGGCGWQQPTDGLTSYRPSRIAWPEVAYCRLGTARREALLALLPDDCHRSSSVYNRSLHYRVILRRSIGDMTPCRRVNVTTGSSLPLASSRPVLTLDNFYLRRSRAAAAAAGDTAL